MVGGSHQLAPSPFLCRHKHLVLLCRCLEGQKLQVVQENTGGPQCLVQATLLCMQQRPRCGVATGEFMTVRTDVTSHPMQFACSSGQKLLVLLRAAGASMVHKLQAVQENTCAPQGVSGPRSVAFHTSVSQV